MRMMGKKSCVQGNRPISIDKRKETKDKRFVFGVDLL